MTNPIPDHERIDVYRIAIEYDYCARMRTEYENEYEKTHKQGIDPRDSIQRC